ALVGYLGVAGWCVASILNYLISRKAKRHGADVTLKSVITCPQCGHQAEETMPTNACLFFYDCPACGAKLKPKLGDCCVFCSYGSVPCPPVQIGSVVPKIRPQGYTNVTRVSLDSRTLLQQPRQ